MKQPISRRSFLRQTAAMAAAPLILPRLSLAQPSNGKLQHACVGVGNMGRSDLNSLLNAGNIDIVAICDVDKNMLEAATERIPHARKYRDWREMLAEETDRIDSVNVSTPDHMHAVIATAAIEKGKHVYCQKPLTHEVYEARQLTLAAAKAGVVTQMGIQIHSHEAYRTGVKVLQDGVIGKIKEWHTWCGAAGRPQKVDRPGKGRDPIPRTLHWEDWIGVAPMRPYKDKLYHPFNWRGWQDFGTGALGDFACHLFDPIFCAIKPGPPLLIWTDPVEINKETWPMQEVVHYEFAGSPMTAGKTVAATWYDGGLKPPTDLTKICTDHDLPGTGSLIIGEDGMMILPHWDKPWLYPKEKFAAYELPPLENLDHYGTFINACLGQGRTTAGFDYAGPLAETALLGNIANRMHGKVLKWDAAALKFTNSRKATRMLRRKYRRSFSLEVG